MARLTTFLNPGADAAGAGLPEHAGLDRARLRGHLRGRARRERPEGLLPARGPHGHDRRGRSARSSACVGISMLVGLYMLLGYAGFRTAQRARDRYGRLLAAGLTAMILVQASINLFAVLGLAPLTGVTLPFVSYGNSSLIVTLAAVGLLLNVASGGTATSKAARRTGGRPAAGGLRVYDGGRGAAAARSRPGAAEVPVPRVVIAAGGTAGHVVPALAVADALAERGRRGQLHRHPRARRGEARPRGRLRDRLPRRDAASTARTRCARRRRSAGPRSGSARRAARPARARRGRRDGRRRLRRRARSGLAALAMRLPLVLTEADSHLGLDQPRCSPRGRGASASRSRSPGARDRATCSPAGPSRRRSATADRGAARERFGIAPEDRCLLIFGGSLGALSDQPRRRGGVRPRRAGRRARLPRPPHQPAPATTPRSRPPWRAPAATRCSSTSPGSPTRSPRATSSVARSGGSIFELTAAGRPGDPRPLPVRVGAATSTRTPTGWSGPGAAVVVEDADLDAERLLAEATALIDDPERLASMSAASLSLARPDAAERIAAEILGALARMSGGGEMSGRPPALHRDRRRRDERPRARLPLARAPRSAGSDRAESSYARAPAGGRHRAADRPRSPTRCPPDADVVVSTAIPRGQPGAGPGPRARPAGPPPRRAARRALRR